MSQIYPSEPPPPGPGRHAERVLFEALRDGLPADWYAYHSVAYVELDEAAEGQADFVVLHPQFGLLVIECKGAGVTFSPSAGWQRIGHDGVKETMRECPAAQAQRTVKQLVKALNDRLPGTLADLKKLPLVHGHCVAMPLVRSAGMALPLDMPRLLLLDADDLGQLGTRIAQILQWWHKAAGARVTAMPADQFRRFRKHVLQPELRLMTTLGAQIAGESATLCRLSREQCAMMEGFSQMPKLLVTGGAGTGKTMLALEVARTIAARGGEVLLLCFNSALGRHLAACAEQLAATPGRIYATSFHRLCREAALALGRQWVVPQADGDQQPFWQQEAALMLYEALEQGKLGPWDALVVDEAQDFASRWWTALHEGLRPGPTARQVVFADPAQAVFGQTSAIPDWPQYRLSRNFRNTRHIGELVARLGDGTPQPDERVPEGEPPQFHDLDTAGKVRRQLDTLVEKLVQRQGILPAQITVLTPHRRANSSLADIATLGGIPLVDRPELRDQGMVHSTIGGFKGLESDVVLLADVRLEHQTYSCQSKLHFARSRAKLTSPIPKCHWVPPENGAARRPGRSLATHETSSEHPIR